MQIGNYTEQLDPLWQASLVDDHWHYDVYSLPRFRETGGQHHGEL